MNKVVRFFKKTQSNFNRLNRWTKLALLFAVILIILIVTNKIVPCKEGFTQEKKFVVKRGNEIYDNFYCSIYDDLVYDMNKNKFEIDEIIRIIKPKKNSKILDVGCGKGHHVHLFNKKGFRAEGLDKSKDMIEQANKVYNNLNLKNGDVLTSMTYDQHSFNNISCLYFTIYYIKDKKRLFKNCYDWLKSGGYMVLHLVNRNMFDPILNAADPLHLVSAQKHAKKRITNSIVKFKDFHYKANFKLEKDKNKAMFDETFKDDKTGNVRQNNHVLYMDTQKNILSIAKNTGFILHGKIDMVTCMYEYQYIYILQKPN